MHDRKKSDDHHLKLGKRQNVGECLFLLKSMLRLDHKFRLCLEEIIAHH